MEKRKSKVEKALEQAFHDAFRRNCAGMQFNIMDLSKLELDTLALHAGGKTMDEAVQEAAAKYAK